LLHLFHPLLVFPPPDGGSVLERIRRREVAVFDEDAPEPAESWGLVT
jgi:hypothetical protein